MRLEEMARQTKRDRTRKLGLRWGIAIPVFFALVFGLVWLTKNDDSSTTSPTTPGTTAQRTGEVATGPLECPAADGSSPVYVRFAEAPKMCIDPTKSYEAVFDTTEGTFTAKLDTSRTPNTTNNFVVLTRYHYYDGTPIFRADNSIDIIQAGGENPSSDVGYTIADEGGTFTYTAGDLVMARTDAPNSAGAQFFIAGGPKVSNLDGQGTYVTFGKITSGLDVVTKMVGYADPNNPMGISKSVTINSITIKEAASTGSSTPSTDGTGPAGTSVAPTGTSVAATGSAPASTTA